MDFSRSMASWLGLEPKTVRLEGGSSIQLSYHDSSNNISNPNYFFKSDFRNVFRSTLMVFPLRVTII